jgi:hypothetical protein
MKIEILESALADLKEGYLFYQLQQSDLGAYFMQSILSDIESLRLYAGIHKISYRKYFRLLSKRFPFAVYYRIEDGIIRIYAIIDCRKDPAWIRDRLHYT